MSEYALRTETINGYEDFVADKVNLDLLLEETARAESRERLGLGGLAAFRKSHQGVTFYETWDSSTPVERMIQLTREYAAEGGMLIQVDEVIVDPGMTFVVGKVWV